MNPHTTLTMLEYYGHSGLIIRPFVIRQNGTNINLSVPARLHYLPTNLYTSVVDFIHFHCLVEEALERVMYSVS